MRFLFGAAEAGAFPNAAKVMARWFPPDERGRVQGVMLAFSQFGAVLAPAATAYLIDLAGWRAAFVIYGSIGVLWAVGFWFWFRDDPATHSERERSRTRAHPRRSASTPQKPIPARCRGARCSPIAG